MHDLDLVSLLFKPGGRWPVAGAHLVSKIDTGRIVGMRVRVCACVCVCVSASEAINN